MSSSLRRRLAEGHAALGAWCALGSPLVAEFCAGAGFDYVCIDLQHGIAGTDTLATLLMAAGSAGATPLVRVGGPDQIGPALDRGAAGVVVPMVETPEDAERAVRAARYPPSGARSFGPTRARLHLNRGRTPAEVNDEVLCLVMIETPEGVANASRICAVPGVDGVYIGPSDLALGLGEPLGPDGPSGVVRRALADVRTACTGHGLLAGVHAVSGAVARGFRDEGFHMISIGTDAAVIGAAYAAELDVARRGEDPDGG